MAFVGYDEKSIYMNTPTICSDGYALNAAEADFHAGDIEREVVS